MVRMKIVPYSILFGLLVSLTLLFSINQGGVVAAAQAAPPRIEPASLLAQKTVTTTQPVSGTLLTPVQAQPPLTVTVPITLATGVTGAAQIATPTPASQLPIVELQPDEVLTGTIVLNRSTGSVFFFLDNDLYQLPANRGVGLVTARPLAGLTLFSCAAEVTEDPTCDWVTYPIRRSAFYEISADAAVPGQANLRLALASAPPLDIAQIQNRTGADGTILRGTKCWRFPTPARLRWTMRMAQMGSSTCPAACRPTAIASANGCPRLTGAASITRWSRIVARRASTASPSCRAG